MPATSSQSSAPSGVGQLVWCPDDPSLGVGVVTALNPAHVRVRFARLQDERMYTTRNNANIVRYVIGEGESVRDSEGRIAKVQKVSGIRQGVVVYALEDGREAAETELEPNILDVGAKRRLAALDLAHPEVVRGRLAGLRLEGMAGRAGNSAVFGARAQWLPHQIDVATQSLKRDPLRLLLADEVGLGKTVEAALIYAGLRQERRADRVLILTPDALSIQWLGEIFRKTHEVFVLLDDERIEDAGRDFPDLTPFYAYQRIVASMPRVVGDAQLSAQAAEASWDLVIVDEAHHLRWDAERGGNPAYRLVEKLAAQARHLLLLTATPMALDPAEYHALLRLLDPLRFDDPRAFAAISARAAAIRACAAALAEAENNPAPAGLPGEALAQARALLADDPHDAELVDALEEAGPTQREPHFAAIFQALRQRHGLADVVVRNRRGPVGGLPERRPKAFALTPTPEQETLIEVGETLVLDLAETIEDAAQRSAKVGELLRALWATPAALEAIVQAHAPDLLNALTPHIQAVVNAPLDDQKLPTGDARLRWLVQTIRSLPSDNKLLVFVESAVAVRALKQALEAVLGQSVAVFHRQLLPRDQDRQVAWFRDKDGPQILLSTEAGGEGRNFQFCHYVVLYDLPWRPATVEQRIGRIDRVGQTEDVHVLVPYYDGGTEAAILKIMQGAIGVLDHTVGGIDHALEHVSDAMADLIVTGADADAWRALHNRTAQQVNEARERIESGVDRILDHASFDRQRVEAALKEVPEDLEHRLEEFVRCFADHNKMQLMSKGRGLFSVEGAPSAKGRETDEGDYTATFHRDVALDYENLEFLSFGHPLVEQAMEWAREAQQVSAALAVVRGFAQEGAVFLWVFGIALPDDVRELSAYFETPLMVFAIDESGVRHPELEGLLEDHMRPLDRMDATPLKRNQKRWAMLIDKNHEVAEGLAHKAVSRAKNEAHHRLKTSLETRERMLARAQMRELTLFADAPAVAERLHAEHDAARVALGEERKRLERGLEVAAPRLIAAVALRLVRGKHVSA